MFSVLALVSAVCYGAADFLGGFTARRAHTIVIVVVSQFAGLVLLAIMLPLLPPASPERDDFLWGAAAGVTGGIGVALLYRALAVGTMAVVAPITAVCAATLPVVIAIMLGERPVALTLVGIGLAIVAIVLVSQQEPSPLDRRGVTLNRVEGSNQTGERRPSDIPLALASGVAVGMFFLSLARTSADAGLWPLIAARLVSVPVFGLLAIGGRRSFYMPIRVGATAVAGGVLDMLANLLYLIATRYGPLSVVVTLSSLYPASTVMLARIVLGERLSARQTTGIVCALLAVVLIVSANR